MTTIQNRKSDTAGETPRPAMIPMADPTPRASREAESRSNFQFHYEADASFAEKQPRLNKTELQPRPGFAQRFVRIRVDGQDDMKNIIKKFNEGWRLRSIDTIPQGIFVSTSRQSFGDYGHADVIGDHNQVLMERPLSLHEDAAAAVKAQTASVTDQLNALIGQADGEGLSRQGATLQSTKDTRATVKYGVPDDDD